jgi:hypothetical protein
MKEELLFKYQNLIKVIFFAHEAASIQHGLIHQYQKRNGVSTEPSQIEYQKIESCSVETPGFSVKHQPQYFV